MSPHLPSPRPGTAEPPPPPAGGPRGRVAPLGRRIAVVTIAAAGGLLVLAGTAFAHVTTDPGTASQGGSAKVAFRTPNEEDAAATVKLEVSFPTDHPVPSVLVQPIPGWTATVEKTNLATPIKTDDGQVTQAVSKITWSGGQIAPGQFEDFDVSLESLPSDTDQLVFKAVQTYSNGDVVRWIDLTQAGQPEPDHPAPVLTLTAASGSDSTAAAGASDSSGGNAAAAASSSSSDGTARGLAAAGLAVSVLALIGVALLLLRGRRSTS
jgi:uncharacterized protein